MPELAHVIVQQELNLNAAVVVVVQEATKSKLNKVTF
jgi:hypothetical protein